MTYLGSSQFALCGCYFSNKSPLPALCLNTWSHKGAMRCLPSDSRLMSFKSCFPSSPAQLVAGLCQHSPLVVEAPVHVCKSGFPPSQSCEPRETQALRPNWTWDMQPAARPALLSPPPLTSSVHKDPGKDQQILSLIKFQDRT